MARVNPQEFADKWSRNTTGAIEFYRQGIQKVTEAPGLKAAAQADKMLARITEAIQSGRWAQKVSAVGLQAWKDAALQKGAGRIQQGVTQAIPRVVLMAGNLLAAVDEGTAKLQNMPSTTIEDSIARVEVMMRHMHSKKGQI